MFMVFKDYLLKQNRHEQIKNAVINTHLHRIHLVIIVEVKFRSQHVSLNSPIGFKNKQINKANCQYSKLLSPKTIFNTR